MTRRTLAASVLTVWIGAVGWLVYREYRPAPDALLSEAALTLPPGATYYLLSLGGQQIGFASNTVDTLPDTVRVLDVMVLEVPTMGRLHRTDAQTVALLSRELVLRSFVATLRGDLGTFAARGDVEGDSVLAVELQTGDTRQNLRVPLERPPVLPALLPLHVSFGGTVQVGRSYRMTTFDPLLLREREVALTVTGDSTFILPDSAVYDSSAMRWVAARWDTVHAFRINQDLGGMAVDAWIDDYGRVVQATSPVGFTMQRSAFELAHENFRRRSREEALAAGAGDIVRQTAVASNVRLDGARLATLRVRLRKVGLSGFDLAGGRQTLSGDTLIVQQETPELLAASYRLPAQGAEWSQYLGAEPLIQTADPRIQAQARQIVDRVRDPRRAAERLTDWVYRTLEKDITISVPSAVQVLEARRGDCNEHTVLFVALARAVGLPARTAAGLVYLDGRFYYHAWPEVYLNGWVAVDPTLNQFPADAAHLRFTVGGLARQVELIRLIGQLELEVTP